MNTYTKDDAEAFTQERHQLRVLLSETPKWNIGERYELKKLIAQLDALLRDSHTWE